MFAADIPPPAAAPTYWDRPDTDPWRGSREQALTLLASTGVASVGLLAQLPHDFCRMRSIRDGEVMNAMVFARNRVMTGVVARTSRWPVTASRLVMECSDGFGHLLLYPIVCGNWSYEGGSVLPPYGPGGAAGSVGEEGEAGSYESGGYGGSLGSGGYGFGSGYGSAYQTAFETPGGLSPMQAFAAGISPAETENELPPTGGGIMVPTIPGIPGAPGTPTGSVPSHAPVPEPPSWMVLVVGVLGTLAMRRMSGISLPNLFLRIVTFICHFRHECGYNEL